MEEKILIQGKKKKIVKLLCNICNNYIIICNFSRHIKKCKLKFCEICKNKLLIRQKRFCSKQCHLEEYHKKIKGKKQNKNHVIKRVESRKNNGKLWNEKLIGKKSKLKNKTYEEISGNENAKNRKYKLSNSLILAYKENRKSKIFSNEAKKKMRVSRIKYLNFTGNCYPNIGKNEVKLLNEQEIIDNCNIKRQYHIKELGYTVDGYCKETNTVYEVYEKRHFNKKTIEKDKKRQNEIENFLNCKFKIIKDNEK